MKKIVAIIGSPENNGNSETLLRAFLEGTKSTNSVDILVYDLKDIPMENYNYRVRTPLHSEKEFCSLLKNIQRADCLIVATPTYNFSVPAKVNNFVDRLSYIALNYKEKNIFGQPKGQLKKLKTYFIVSGGTSNLVKGIFFPLFPDFWLQIVFWYYGASRVGSFYGGSLTYVNHARNKRKLLKKVRRKGKMLALKL